MRATALRLRGADGIGIAADSYGEPAAPAVVFLHGGGQGRTAWQGAARAAARDGYHALSIDLRGHGHSDWAPDGDYRFSSYGRDIIRIVEPLGQAALVGASLGGRVAILAAAMAPERVGAVALADVAPRVDEAATLDMRTFFRSARNGFETVEQAAALLGTLRESRPGGSPDKLRPHLREAGGRFYWRWDPRFAEDRFIGAPDELRLLEDSARQVTAPVVMIRAQHSTVVRPEHLAAFHDLVPHAELREAAGIGHMLTGDANDAYAPIILEFLGRVYR